jgi:hypothetical protein
VHALLESGLVACVIVFRLVWKFTERARYEILCRWFWLLTMNLDDAPIYADT